VKTLASNFEFLRQHDEQLVRLGLLAERYFPDDPNTCLLKLRQLTELLAQLTASRVGALTVPAESQYDLLRRLQDTGILPREVAQLFGEIRRVGNDANHQIAGDHRIALNALRVTWQLGLWYHRTFKDSSYKSGPFIPPRAPPDESLELKEELKSLREAVTTFASTHSAAAKELEAARASLRAAQEDQAFWEQMASEAEQSKAALERRLSEQQAQGAAQSSASVASFIAAAGVAASNVILDEAATREIIDGQLIAAGWTADSSKLTYAKGARPLKGQNLAIAEWPTGTGPADYVLFIGLMPVATVEAKRSNTDVSGSLQQAKRYSRGMKLADGLTEFGAPWGEYCVPFAFSTNGRPYLKQLETKSGIWFCDLRRPNNLARALDAWYSPEGLLSLLKMDAVQAEARLAKEGFEYGFPLRFYQKAAIQAVEQGVRDGKRRMLLAMATGTGKTKTCIALIYRFLKTQRFNRVLFLVDRSALGEQAANAFKDTRMENLNTFASVFGIKELDEASPDTETKVHIATVQGMVARVLNPSESTSVPTVDSYDCIIIDECHRGYLLDRELSETELGFRGFEDYVSKYRRVIDYFDAVKVGLTATPALHTVQIFGQPIYTYSYREAVVDGFLIDHEPPIQINTELSAQGIQWRVGEEVQVYDPRKNQIELFNAPDTITLEVEAFNRKVITKPFNQVVCEYLASELDPSSRHKTLIFCANDSHADLVVELLKKAFVKVYGDVEDDAVVKITGASDKPLELIRRYKNEILPNVAVTVDLLTTGIDAPEICNIVFLRRVNSRILFDQMLGRATRLCEDIEKSTFRVFDAVRLYEAIGDMTAMRPVVVDPSISFKQLVRELAGVQKDDERRLVLDQFLAKLQVKKRHLDERARQEFETVAGVAPDEFIKKLKKMTLPEVSNWFTENSDLGEILDRKRATQADPVLISTHPDQLKKIERGYGVVKRPEDYLDAFSAFIRSNGNRIPALTAVLTRPRELTRKQLRELKLELDKAGFSESTLEIAWREMTNQDIAASIIGFIRRSAIGDPLIPFELRVDRALAKILASKKWTSPQKQWLQTIANQTKANLLVDQDALNDENLIFRTEGGGFPRLNKLFDGQLTQVLDQFNDEIWPPAAAANH
jgi:type I restriction enzyme, R subunit